MSNELKCTPGKWEVKRSADGHRWQVIGDRLVLVEHTFDGEQAEANAHLIAASKDLYNALNSVVSLFHNYAKHPHEIIAINKAYRALEKANPDYKP